MLEVEPSVDMLINQTCVDLEVIDTKTGFVSKYEGVQIRKKVDDYCTNCQLYYRYDKTFESFDYYRLLCLSKYMVKIDDLNLERGLWSQIGAISYMAPDACIVNLAPIESSVFHGRQEAPDNYRVLRWCVSTSDTSFDYRHRGMSKIARDSEGKRE